MNNLTIIAKIKNEKIPLYLWGCGNVAREVYNVLSENGISITGCMVDVDVTATDFMGFSIEKMQDVIHRENSLNIVIGHAQYHRKRELAAYQNVKNVYCLPNPFRTHEDITEEYYNKHKENFEEAYHLFDEEFSKKVFRAYIESKVNGHIDAIFDAFSRPITYFDNDIWSLEEETYVDCGAYNGDTVKMFIKAVSGKYKSIYAFEPDHNIFGRLIESVHLFDDGRIHLYEKGLWNRNAVLPFSFDEEQSGFATEAGGIEGESTIDVCRLDDIINEQVTLIKINMSGSDKECIEGARRIITEHHPKIAITVGLAKECLYQIPILLKKYNPRYKLFLRFNESMPSRICLYAKDASK